ncbi:unnamed protein product, partial [Mesorhabditis belari]|uniref:Uncharacterized protein n=1 Tax=Mesorhabditis belari TaxID=2138241 RepID=A0AAF3FG06_9BILA
MPKKSHVVNVKNSGESTHVSNASFLDNEERDALGGSGSGKVLCTQKSMEEVGSTLQDHGWNEIRAQHTENHSAFAKRM